MNACFWAASLQYIYGKQRLAYEHGCCNCELLSVQCTRKASRFSSGRWKWWQAFVQHFLDGTGNKMERNRGPPSSLLSLCVDKQLWLKGELDCFLQLRTPSILMVQLETEKGSFTNPFFLYIWGKNIRLFLFHDFGKKRERIENVIGFESWCLAEEGILAWASNCWCFPTTIIATTGWSTKRLLSVDKSSFNESTLSMKRPLSTKRV